MMTTVLPLLRCPLCGGEFEKQGASLVCAKRHTYDIARLGCVNFVPQQKESFYKKELFESRAKVFAAGVYAPVIDALSDALVRHIGGENPVLVDAGCGEGYYTKAICPGRAMTRIGFDLSKEAVHLAAKGPKTAFFCAADLKNIPLRDGCADALLDIFTPANYAEFARVLAPQGLVFKLAPRANYLVELRQAAAHLLRHSEYDGGQVERYAQEKMNLIEQKAITYTMPVEPQTVYHLARMTPMLAGIDVDQLDLSGVKSITIDETLYIGSVRDTARHGGE